MNQMSLGIDFGTCFSFPAVLINDEPRSLLSSRINNGNRGIPSVFYFDQKNGEMVGVKAEQYGERKLECMVKNIKRNLSIKEYLLDGKRYEAIDICARILSEVTNQANMQLETDFAEEPIHSAVIAVPVKFGDRERSLIRKAAQIPRLQGGPELIIKNFIQEPVAAAIDYSEMIKSADKVLVYDLGGGTFDLALVIPTPNKAQLYEVIDFDGINIGGNDFDHVFCDYLEKLFFDKHGLSFIGKVREKNNLLKAARKAKEELSESLSTIVEIQDDGIFKECEVTRLDFERIIKPSLDKTLEITKHLALKHNLVGLSYLHVIMVGGSSYIPKIKEELTSILGEGVRINLHRPEKAIAFGAARFGENVNIVLQLAPFSYGVDVCYSATNDDLRIQNMIYARTPLPTQTREERFVTHYENQNFVKFDVYQNDETSHYVDLEKGKKILQVRIAFSCKVPKGTPVRAQMSLKEDGTLLIRAIDPATNNFEENSVIISDFPM